MTECVVIYSVVKETDLHKGLQKTKTNSICLVLCVKCNHKNHSVGLVFLMISDHVLIKKLFDEVFIYVAVNKYYS